MFAIRLVQGFVVQGMFNLSVPLLVEIVGTAFRVPVGILVNVRKFSQQKFKSINCVTEFRPDSLRRGPDGGGAAGLRLPVVGRLLPVAQPADAAVHAAVVPPAGVAAVAAGQGQGRPGGRGAAQGRQDQRQEAGPGRVAVGQNGRPRRGSETTSVPDGHSCVKHFWTLSLQASEEPRLGAKFLFSGWTVLRITLVLWVNWVAVSMCYYGLAYVSVSLSDDIYLSFVLSSIVEIPSYVAAALVSICRSS
jgi:hypothetical protein